MYRRTRRRLETFYEIKIREIGKALGRWLRKCVTKVIEKQRYAVGRGLNLLARYSIPSLPTTLQVEDSSNKRRANEIRVSMRGGPVFLLLRSGGTSKFLSGSNRLTSTFTLRDSLCARKFLLRCT